MVFKKLGKSLVAGSDLNAGDVLTLDNLSGKIFGEQYIAVRDSYKIIGRKLKKPVSTGSLILMDDLE